MLELRPLGPFERAYDLWNRRHPHHFCTVLRLPDDVDPEELGAALRAVQLRHPLLQARVQDIGAGHAGDSPSFVRVDDPIPLRVSTADRWEDAVAEELATAMRPGQGPLARAVLVGTWLVLSLQHAIADGLSAVTVLRDVEQVLRGATLPQLPVPESQEQLLTRAPRVDTPTPDAVDARLVRASTIRPFDGAVATVRSCSFTERETTAVIRSARAAGATVTAAVTAAVAQNMSVMRREQYLRVNLPISLRGVADVTDRVALAIGGTRFAVEPERDGLWAMARTVAGHLRDARRPAALAAASDAVAGLFEYDLDDDDVEQALVAANSFELTLSNLGDLGAGAEVWGPMLLAQVEGEEMVGVTTVDGVFRLTHVSHEPTDGLLEQVRADLVAAS